MTDRTLSDPPPAAASAASERPRDHRHEVVAATRVVGMLTLVSRFGGLVRDAVSARVFGVSEQYTAFTFAFLLPNLFRRLFGEGALTAAFLPEYTRLLERDRALARRFASLTIRTTMLGLSALVLLVEVGFALAWWLERGNQAAPSTRVMAIELAMITLPYMPFICLTALLGAVLQAHGRFAPSAAAPIILSACIVVPAAFTPFIDRLSDEFVTHTGLYLVAWGVFASGLVQTGWMLWSLHIVRREEAPRERKDAVAAIATHDTGGADDAALLCEARARMRGVFRLMLPMVLGLGVLQLNTLLDSLIAQYPILVGPTFLGREYPLDGRAGTILTYAQRLYQFPLGVFGIAVATAIFPALSRTAPRPEEFVATLRQGLRLTMFIGLPASLGLALVAHPLTAAAFLGGRFEPADVPRVAKVLVAYAPAVCAYSMFHILTRGFYALGDARTPVRVSLAMVAANVALNVTLIWSMNESGLAASTSICSIVQVAVLLILLRRRLGAPLVDAGVRRAWSRIALASVVMAAAVGGVARVWPWESGRWSAQLIQLVVLSAVGIAAYLVLAWIGRFDELGWLLHRRRPEAGE